MFVYPNTVKPFHLVAVKLYKLELEIIFAHFSHNFPLDVLKLLDLRYTCSLIGMLNSNFFQNRNSNPKNSFPVVSYRLTRGVLTNDWQDGQESQNK